MVAAAKSSGKTAKSSGSTAKSSGSFRANCQMWQRDRCRFYREHCQTWVTSRRPDRGCRFTAWNLAAHRSPAFPPECPPRGFDSLPGVPVMGRGCRAFPCPARCAAFRFWKSPPNKKRGRGWFRRSRGARNWPGPRARVFAPLIWIHLKRIFDKYLNTICQGSHDRKPRRE